MTMDLWMLVASALLCIALILPYTHGTMMARGLPYLAGNREDSPLTDGWVGRARRAHMNMVENLGPFAVLVLTAHITGKADAGAVMGAELFFAARVVHAVTYIMGIPWIRTLAFFASLIGEIMILMALFR